MGCALSCQWGCHLSSLTCSSRLIWSSIWMTQPSGFCSCIPQGNEQHRSHGVALPQQHHAQRSGPFPCQDDPQHFPPRLSNPRGWATMHFDYLQRSQGHPLNVLPSPRPSQLRLSALAQWLGSPASFPEVLLIFSRELVADWTWWCHAWHNSCAVGVGSSAAGDGTAAGRAGCSCTVKRGSSAASGGSAAGPSSSSTAGRGCAAVLGIRATLMRC